MLRYLLDTDIVVYVVKRRPVGVLATFDAKRQRLGYFLHHPIGMNDLHIEGHARSEGLVQVTNKLAGIRAGARARSGELPARACKPRVSRPAVSFAQKGEVEPTGGFECMLEWNSESHLSPDEISQTQPTAMRVNDD